jgi:hypothetical protein
MAFFSQAQEDNEMSLTEGELIEQIEQVDEGWWSGIGQGGAKSGLFPCMCCSRFFPLTSSHVSHF